MTTVPEIFGSKVFDSRVMKARLSGEVYCFCFDKNIPIVKCIGSLFVLVNH